MALSSLIFKGELPHPDDFILQLNEKDLGYVLKTDDNDIPYFLHQQINEIVQIGNNFLIMMQEEEREYYNLCKTDCYIEIKFEPSNIDDTHKQFMEKLDLKYALLKQKQYDLRYQEERNKYLKLQKKVDYLRRIKLVHWLIDNLYKCQETEKLQEENNLKIEEKRKQKESLKSALEDQIYNKKVIERYQKEIQKELERSLMVKTLYFPQILA